MSEDAKHTDGPWRVDDQSHRDNQFIRVCTTVSHERLSVRPICDISWDDADLTGEDLANAQLMARAPDMNEAIWKQACQIEELRAALAPFAKEECRYGHGPINEGSIKDCRSCAQIFDARNVLAETECKKE